MAHIPVLLDEVIKCLDPKSNENFIDATFGEGGHTIAILKKTGPNGKVLGIEADFEMYEKTQLRMAEFSIFLSSSRFQRAGNFSTRDKSASDGQFPNRLILINDSYTNLKQIVEKYKFGPINGILFDLGMSSWHLEESGRGFSFLRDEPLDMRYGNNVRCQMSDVRCLTAANIVNNCNEKELADIFWKYGEERFSRRIARRIAEERKKKPIKTTFDLVEIIKKSVPKNYESYRIHPATRVFQALRIVVNNELENFKIGLSQALEVLAPAGRIVAISFHSGEDRIVKNFFREKKQEVKILTKKPIIPRKEEIYQNPRSRSAKLRAAIKIKK